MTFITVGIKVSCLLRFTLAANSGAHVSQFRDGSLISCWSRIRKFVTYREHIDRQTHRENNYRGHSNPMDRWVEWANIGVSAILGCVLLAISLYQGIVKVLPCQQKTYNTIYSYSSVYYAFIQYSKIQYKTLLHQPIEHFCFSYIDKQTDTFLF